MRAIFVGNEVVVKTLNPGMENKQCTVTHVAQNVGDLWQFEFLRPDGQMQTWTLNPTCSTFVGIFFSKRSAKATKDHLVAVCGNYVGFYPAVSDADIRQYMDETYGVCDCDIALSPWVKLAGPVVGWDKNISMGSMGIPDEWRDRESQERKREVVMEDLLRTCKSSEKALRNLYASWDLEGEFAPGSGQMLENEIKKVQAVIAKVEGREP